MWINSNMSLAYIKWYIYLLLRNCIGSPSSSKFGWSTHSSNVPSTSRAKGRSPAQLNLQNKEIVSGYEKYVKHSKSLYGLHYMHTYLSTHESCISQLVFGVRVTNMSKLLPASVRAPRCFLSMLPLSNGYKDISAIQTTNLRCK